ncbi:MAG: AI-2E family transporter, partial [Thermoguttaceae bacterium]|nr:AI-2E family transporter [Thermoguttaceae bacterium]
MAHREDHPVGIGTIAGIAIVLAALYFLQEVLLPFALALLLSFLLTPVVMWLERGRVRRIPAVALTATMTLAVFAGILWLMGTQLNALLADLIDNRQQYKQNLVERARSMRGMMSDCESDKLAETLKEIPKEIAEDEAPVRIDRDEAQQDDTEQDEEAKQGVAVEEPATAEAAATEDAGTGPTAEDRDTVTEERTMQDVLDRFLSGEEPVAVRVVETESTPPPQSMLRDWLGPILAPLGTAAIVVVFVIFILIQREDLRDRLIRLAGTRRVYLTTQAIDDAAARISRYLLMQLIINATYGLAVAVGLFFIGLPNALVWGLL